MIYSNVLLHNFEGAYGMQGNDGILLKRLPKDVLERIRSEGKIPYENASGGEIRFVCDWESDVEVKLKCYSGIGSATVFYGDCQDETYRIDCEIKCIKLKKPLFMHNEKYMELEWIFNPKVCRILLEGQICLISVNGSGVRPPEVREVPQKTFVSYGTSITQGFRASLPHLSYVKQLTNILNMDCLNFGCSGNAYCETAIAEYIATLDCEFVTICISVNMLNQGVSLDEFKQKAEQFISIIAASHKNKHIFCISILPSFLDIELCWPDRNPKATVQEYRDCLLEIVNTSNMPKLKYIDGSKLLDINKHLSADTLHPSDYGMTIIAQRLAEEISKLRS
jgi:lysophospholipase L1-like esterase